MFSKLSTKTVTGKLNSHLNQLRCVFYRQDNAGCYHCGVFIVGASFAIRHHEVFVKRLDFSDPQCGKGPCDRKAASLNSHMRVHLNQGSNIETSKGNGRRYPVIRGCSRSQV